MRKFKILLFTLLIPITLVGSKRIDGRACKVFTKNLGIIKKRLINKPGQDIGKVNHAIDFLEEITGIQSHSDGGFLGRFDPTETDYQNWLHWFKKNNAMLYWDNKEHKVKVKHG